MQTNINERFTMNTIGFTVYQDGEIAEDYMPKEPPKVIQAVEAVKSAVTRTVSATTANTATQARLYVFDAFHGTHYARVRRELRREVKKEQICKATGIYDLLRQTGHRV